MTVTGLSAALGIVLLGDTVMVEKRKGGAAASDGVVVGVSV